jgi:hypothetical protein
MEMVIGKKFQSDKAAQLRVFRFVDNAHSTATEFVDDAVVRDCLTDE